MGFRMVLPISRNGTSERRYERWPCERTVGRMADDHRLEPYPRNPRLQARVCSWIPDGKLKILETLDKPLERDLLLKYHPIYQNFVVSFGPDRRESCTRKIISRLGCSAWRRGGGLRNLTIRTRGSSAVLVHGSGPRRECCG